MNIDRKRNAIRGTLYGLILKAVQVFFPFIIRTIIIHTLGAEYLGLNSLFSAILQVLNLAELGVSSALVFSMYRPIAENDSEKICQLLNIYKVYYRIIGLVVLIIGIILVPFLPKLIKGTIPDNINLYVLYSMHLTATVLSYWLYAYRNSLFAAHQRNDITSIINIIVNIVLYSLQALSLIYFKNYYVYLLLSIIAQILINIITAFTAKLYYPGYKPRGELPFDERKKINRSVRDLFTAKIGSVINNAADSIVISAFIGLEVLAIYQNYYYIISALMAMFNIFFSACTAGIGNSLIVNKTEKNREILYKINHIVFLGINYCCTCFVCLCQPFMQLWIGEKYKLDYSFVVLLAIYLFSEEAPRTLIVFKDAGGIWRYDRFRPLISACVNLMLNVILTPIIGLYGIIISTVFAMLFVSFPWVIINIDNRLFEIGIKKYLTRLLEYTFLTAVSAYSAYYICSLIVIHNTILALVVEFIISSTISIVYFLIMFWRAKETKYLLQNIGKMLKNRRV